MTLSTLFNSKAVRSIGVVAAMLTGIVASIAVSEMYVRTQVPVSLWGNHIFVSAWDSGYVTLEGTWVIDGDRHANPLNMSLSSMP